jgi:hypothetical protein
VLKVSFDRLRLANSKTTTRSMTHPSDRAMLAAAAVEDGNRQLGK